jgi:hypothetical protein
MYQKKLDEWLNAENGGVSNKHRFAMLIGRGGPRPNGYGFITMGGPFGQAGLEQEEFIQMMEFTGFLAGLEMVDDESARYVCDQIHEEMERIVSGLAVEAT